MIATRSRPLPAAAAGKAPTAATPTAPLSTSRRVTRGVSMARSAGLPDLAWVASGFRGEEVDEQLVHALGLVVVHPVGRVRQALDPLEVGHVLLVRLGELGPEVPVALAPDDHGGCRDGEHGLLR